MSTRTFTTRRTSVGATILVAAVLTLVQVGTVGSAHAQADGTTFTVYGHPRSASGKITNGTISFFKHASSRRVGYGHVNGDGLLVAHIKRRDSLKRMAASHGGIINLDLAIKKGRRLYMRGVRLTYDNSTDTLGTFRMARISYRSGSNRTTTYRMATSLDGVHTFSPVVMFVPHGPDEATHYEFSSNGSTAAEIGFGADVKSFKASGSMEVAATSAGAADGTFGNKGKTRGHNAGKILRLPMTTTTTVQYLGLVNSYGMVVSQIPTYTSKALWDGHVEESRTDAYTCGSDGITDQYWFTKQNSTLGYTKESGQSVKSVGSIGVGGMSAQLTTSWGKSVMEHFGFDLRHQAGYDYCLGGRGGSWLTGDKVGISTFPKSSSAPCAMRTKPGVNVVMAADDPGLSETVIPTC